MPSNNDFAQGKLFPMILRYSIPAAISLLISILLVAREDRIMTRKQRQLAQS